MQAIAASAKLDTGCATVCRRGLKCAAPGAPARPPWRRPAVAASSTGSRDGAAITPQQQDAASLDISAAVVQPVFRSTPWDARHAGAGAADPHVARVCLVSESGVCRCVLAEASLRAALQRRGLAASFHLDCRASRDYCLGQGPEPPAVRVAQELGWTLPEGYQARQFEEARDIVEFDVVLVMDKFVAADVLREVRPRRGPGCTRRRALPCTAAARAPATLLAPGREVRVPPCQGASAHSHLQRVSGDFVGLPAGCAQSCAQSCVRCCRPGRRCLSTTPSRRGAAAATPAKSDVWAISLPQRPRLRRRLQRGKAGRRIATPLTLRTRCTVS